MENQNPLFVTYWLGYANNGLALSSLPQGIDIVNLFLINLYPDPALQYNYITSDGMSWSDIMTGSRTLQQRGVKVVASIMSTPNPPISWNTIADPESFAEQVYDLVVNQWQLDGIDIDPEIGGGEAPNSTFIAVVKALSKYFGPQSGTGKIMSYVSYQLYNDNVLLTDTNGMFDYVMLMGYFWDYNTMLSQFKQYAAIVGNQNVLFGVQPGNSSQSTPLDEAVELARWQPATGNQKGGMMLYNINIDTNFAYTTAVMNAMGITASSKDPATKIPVND